MPYRYDWSSTPRRSSPQIEEHVELRRLDKARSQGREPFMTATVALLKRSKNGEAPRKGGQPIVHAVFCPAFLLPQSGLYQWNPHKFS